MKQLRPIAAAAALAATLALLPACTSISITSPDTQEETAQASSSAAVQDSAAPEETVAAATESADAEPEETATSEESTAPEASASTEAAVNSDLLGLYTLDFDGDGFYLYDNVDVTAATADSLTFALHYTNAQSTSAQTEAITAALSGDTAAFSTQLGEETLSGQLTFSGDVLTLTVDSGTESIAAGSYDSFAHWKPVPAQLTAGQLGFTFPESYQEQVYYTVYESDGDQTYLFNQITSLRSIGGGWLFGIGISQTDEYEQLPSFETLASIGGVNYYVEYPTDVQFDPEIPGCQEEYTALYDEIQTIVFPHSIVTAEE